MKLLLVSLLLLTSCASLKPIESTSKDVPNDLPQEIQHKFQVADTPPVVAPKPETKKPAKSIKGKKTAVKKEPDPIPVLVKKFNPIVGQKVIFAVYAPLGVRAGTLIAKVDSYKTINNQEVVLLKANIYNAAFFASIFTINLLVESYVDPIDFKSVRYQITGQEGKLNKQTIELYDYEKQNIIEYKTSYEQGQKKTEQNTYNILNSQAQDLLSSFWKVVSLDFSEQKEHSFAVASGNSVKIAKVVKLSDYESGWVLGLSFDANQNPEDRKIYLNKQTHLVDRIEANIKWGKFKVIRVESE